VRCVADMPLAIHVLCGLGMTFGVAMLIIGTVVRDSSRGKILMICGVVSCVVAFFAWNEILAEYINTCR
jgi:hypothetical protein